MKKPYIDHVERFWIINYPNSNRAANARMTLACGKLARAFYDEKCDLILIKSIDFLRVMIERIERYYFKLFKK